jgi:hypothetical protein
MAIVTLSKPSSKYFTDVLYCLKVEKNARSAIIGLHCRDIEHIGRSRGLSVKNRSSDVCGQYTLFFALHRCRRIPMSTIANMFTGSKEWNDELVRDFIDKWYKH